MNKIILAASLGFLLILLGGPTWAGGFSVGFRSGGFHSGGAKVFIGHGRPFFHDRFFFGHRTFVGHPFFHRGVIIGPRFHSKVIISPPVGVVRPFPVRARTSGFWHWNGFQWVWVP